MTAEPANPSGAPIRELTVSQAVDSRRSVRAFVDTPVDMALLKEILRLAARTASGGNLQPWRVVVASGEALERLRAAMRIRLAGRPERDPPQYQVYPAPLGEPYRTQRFRVGEMMYAQLGIPHEDKAARRRWFERNYQLFGAPAALFVFAEPEMGIAQWTDLGAWLQTVMLLLRARGLDSCPQEAWSAYHSEVSAVLNTDPRWVLFSGLAIGYADEAAPVNNFRTERMTLDEHVRFVTE